MGISLSLSLSLFISSNIMKEGKKGKRINRKKSNKKGIMA